MTTPLERANLARSRRSWELDRNRRPKKPRPFDEEIAHRKRENRRLLYTDLRRRAISLFGQRTGFPKIKEVIIEPEAIWFMERHIWLFWLSIRKGDAGIAYRLSYREWIKSLHHQLPPAIYDRLAMDFKRREVPVSERPWADRRTYFAKLRRWWAHPEQTPKWAIRDIDSRMTAYERRPR